MTIDQFRDQYAFLSNFYPCTILYGVWEFPSVEHFYQAMKTTNSFSRTAICAAPTPSAAKKLGRTIVLREDWDEIRIPVMKLALKKKFVLGTVLGYQLLATGSETLVEGNWWGDTFWGVCKDVGHNHLGILLMNHRQVLRTALEASVS